MPRRSRRKRRSRTSLSTSGGLSPVVRVTADSRTNSLIVQASPRDMAEVAELIRQIDVIKVDEGRSTRCGSFGWNTRLPRTSPRSCRRRSGLDRRRAGAGNQGGQRRPGRTAGSGTGGQPVGPGGQPFGQGQNPPGTAGVRQNEQRAAMLRFLMVDAKGRKAAEFGNPHATSASLPTPGQRPDDILAAGKHGIAGRPRAAIGQPARSRGPDQGLHHRQRRCHEPFRHAQDALHGAGHPDRQPARRP